MQTGAQGEGTKYEHPLRVIGRHLDSVPSFSVSVDETEDGFTVRYQPTRNGSEVHTIEFTWDRLRDLSVFQSGGRGLTRKHERGQAAWDKFPGGRQEFFRSLGYALDRDSASNLTVQELPDQLLVTYSVPDPSDPDKMQMERMELREQEILDLSMEARKRRRQNRSAAKP